MEHFVNAQNVFTFPEHLFPTTHTSQSSVNVLNDLPLPGQRRATILARTPSHSQVDAIMQQPRSNTGSGIVDWCHQVLEFHDTWSPMPAEVVELVIKLLTVLANNGNNNAAYFLGTLSALRISPESIEELVDGGSRRKYLRQALKNGVNGSWYRVAMNANERGDVEQALSRFQRGADKKEAACLYTMGLAHLQGQFGFAQNVERGLNLIELSVKDASSEFPRAPYLLGKIWIGEGGTGPNGLGIEGLDGHVTPNKVGSGIELISRSARLGFSPALLRMADAYLGHQGEGGGGERGFDASVALRYLCLASCQDLYRRYRSLPPILGGKPEAQIVKWLLCGYDNVISKSEVWAYRFAEIGALDQDGAALFALAYFNEVGINTEQNQTKAKALYQLSADHGFSPALARLQQLQTGVPALRRSLTKRDHEKRMHKHSAALMNGTLSATDAINDTSTLEDMPTTDKQPSPPPFPGSFPTRQNETSALPYPTSPGLSRPVSPQKSPRRGRHSPHRSLGGNSPGSSRSSLHPSIRSVSELPYPTDEGEQFSTPRVGGISPRTSPMSSVTSLPYPDSPEQRPDKFHTPPPPPSTAVAHGDAKLPTSSLTGPPLGASSTSIDSAPPVSKLESTKISSAPSIQARQGPPITKPVAKLPIEESQASTMEKFQRSQPVLPPQQPPLPPPVAPQSAVSQSAPASRTESLNMKSRDTGSQSPELKPSDSKGSSSNRSESPIPRTNSPRRRPLSAQWISNMRIFSNNGAERSSSPAHSSTTSLDLDSSRSQASSPALTAHKSSSSQVTLPQLSNLQQPVRSASPLRKMFGSTPQQRAAAARADRRSFTEAALAELASAPKVPVQPINTNRVPGVAYTFEEMGVKTVANEKSDKCAIM